MKNFFHSEKFKILLGTVCILLGLTVVTVITGNSIIASVVGFVTTPMQNVSNNIAGSVENNSSSGKTIEELEAENKELKAKLSEMVATTVDYYNLKRENEQNAKYLELKQRKKDYKFASASVIGKNPEDVFYGLTLDQGSIIDIKENDPVITENGLVGRVSKVYPTYCKVETILSPDTKVSAIDQVSRDTGVTSGNIRYSDQGLIKMDYVSAQHSMNIGDIVTTSGIGGVYPSELPIGTVQEIQQRENSSSLDIILKPYEDIKNVRNVFVITEFLGQGQTVADNDKPNSSGG